VKGIILREKERLDPREEKAILLAGNTIILEFLSSFPFPLYKHSKQQKV
jgi:hypothetical protein